MSDIKILIVEDERLTALDLREKLENMGFSVAAVVSRGDQAIAKTAETRPHLVLMDIMIEGNMDGIETASRIHRKFNIPVIYLTAYPDDETLQRAKLSEPFGYLIKPYNERELKFIIEIAVYKHKIETELKESEEKYRTLIDNAGNPITYFALDGTILLINTIGARNLGGTPDDFVGKSVYEILPDLTEKTRKRILQLKETNQGCEYLDLVKLPSGSRWFSSNFQPVKNANGEVFAIQIISRDITEGKKAEEALRKERDRAQRYLDVSGVLIVAINANREVELINQKGCEVLGYSEKEIVGKNWFDHFLPKKERTKVKKGFEQLMKGDIEPVEYFENRVLTKSGDERIIAWYNKILKDENGRITGTLSSGEDITRRRQTEEALRESEERYRTLQANIPLGIYRSTPDGGIISGNPALVRMLGLKSEKELKSVSAADFYLNPQQRLDLLELLEEKKVVTGYEVQFKRKDGSTFWASNNFKGVFDRKGNLLHLDGIMEDITQRKKVEEELLKAEKLKSLGLLAGGIAHDFNNILAAILVNVGLAKLNINEPDKVLAKLSDTEKAILRAKDLTQQLLTFSKGGAPVKNPTSIGGLLRETADFACSGTNVRCDCEIPGYLLDVDIDEGQISQVIQNLIINAEQAMPAGGVIRIEAENVTVGPGQGLPLKAGSYIRISVKDQGIGIPPAHMDKIFDPFFTTKQKGSGLGLSTAYSVIKNHNGLLTVESELGKGTTFYIYLPASEEESEKNEEQEEKGQKAGTKAPAGKILLMDDEEGVLDATAEVLRELGYRVETVNDGVEAVTLYREALQSGDPFNGLVMDLVIPGGLGGKETLQELLKIDPNVKAVVSSGYSTDPIMANYKEYGFCGALSKPFRIKELSTLLRKIMTAPDGDS